MTQRDLLTRHPAQKVGVYVLSRTDAPSLANDRGDRLASLNDTALAIWDLCDGETSVHEMVEAVISAFGISPEQATADVQRTIDKFARLDVVSTQ